FQNSIAPTLLKWSADHMYLAMSVHSNSGNGQSSYLQFWSEQGLIALRPHTNIYDSFQGAVQWSPVGHRLLYQGWNGTSIFIGLASPETASEETWPWQENGGLVVGDSSWSPNGRYVGLFNLSNGPDKTQWYAIVYRIDDTNAVRRIARIDGGDLPLVF